MADSTMAAAEGADMPGGHGAAGSGEVAAHVEEIFVAGLYETLCKMSLNSKRQHKYRKRRWKRTG